MFSTWDRQPVSSPPASRSHIGTWLHSLQWLRSQYWFSSDNSEGDQITLPYPLAGDPSWKQNPEPFPSVLEFCEHPVPHLSQQDLLRKTTEFRIRTSSSPWWRGSPIHPALGRGVRRGVKGADLESPGAQGYGGNPGSNRKALGASPLCCPEPPLQHGWMQSELLLPLF